MLSKKFITSILAAAFMIALSASALADTIRLRDGTTIRGQIIAFKDQQFTVLIGAGTRGRHRRCRRRPERQREHGHERQYVAGR